MAVTESSELATYTPQQALASLPSEIVEKLVVEGDLKGLTPEQRVQYYTRLCQSLGLNPLNRPFQYIILNNKLTLYATKTAAEQVRAIWGMTQVGMERQFSEGLYLVTVTYQARDGRKESATGAVAIDGLKGEVRANAIMKAETKAKRRCTFALCGLGFLDETEAASIPDAQFITEIGDGQLADGRTGEIIGEIVDDPARSDDEPPGDDAEFLSVARLYETWTGKVVDGSNPPYSNHDLDGRKRILFKRSKDYLIDLIGKAQAHSAIDGLKVDWHEATLAGHAIWDEAVEEAFAARHKLLSEQGIEE